VLLIHIGFMLVYSKVCFAFSCFAKSFYDRNRMVIKHCTASDRIYTSVFILSLVSIKTECYNSSAFYEFLLNLYWHSFTKAQS